MAMIMLALPIWEIITYYYKKYKSIQAFLGSILLLGRLFRTQKEDDRSSTTSRSRSPSLQEGSVHELQVMPQDHVGGPDPDEENQQEDALGAGDSELGCLARKGCGDAVVPLLQEFVVKHRMTV